MVNKIKRECFKYFTGRDDEPIKESIKGVTKKFKMPKEMAKSYYFEWREMYMNRDIKGYNHNPWHKDRSSTRVRQRVRIHDE
ncbi:hypothetical protein [Clostridium sp.]|uniref:hypothetical protein n=1 Tax=Clostridium sp. TaxID=1506 RepID=UPI00359FACFA